MLEDKIGWMVGDGKAYCKLFRIKNVFLGDNHGFGLGSSSRQPIEAIATVFMEPVRTIA